MEEEYVINTIKSVYSHKPKILSAFQRNNRKVNTHYIPKISSKLNEFKNINNFSPEKTNSSISNNMNSKTIYNDKFRFKTVANFKIDHSINKNKNNIYLEPIYSKTETVEFKDKKSDLIKIDKTVYLLRKLYIILPKDKMKFQNDFHQLKMQLYFYFPIDIKSRRIIDLIRTGNKNDIICKNLKDIFLMVYKYLKLSSSDFIKSEIYDGKLHPIKLESQLIMKQIRIIYVKITYISEEEINSWRKRIKSRLFFSELNFLKKKIPDKKELNNIYNDVSTEMNPEDSKNITNRKIKNKSLTSFNKHIYKDVNYLLKEENNNSTRYNTINQISEGIKIKDNLKLDLKSGNNHKIIKSGEIKIIQNTHNKKKILDSENSDNNGIYRRTWNKKNNLINEKKEEINKLKLEKKFFADLFRKNGMKKNELISPFLFNFDVTDIINNKYVLKYLSNKNRIETEKNFYENKNKFEIKTLMTEDSDSKRKININLIPNVKRSSIEKLGNYICTTKNCQIDKNKKILCEMNSKINNFVEKNIDNLIFNEEIEDSDLLSCNYVLINELKNFPILQLKKKFIFFVYLYIKINSKYKEIYTEIKADQYLLDNILNLDEFEQSLYYLNNIYNNTLKKKNFLVGYLKATNLDLKISFNFFLLFIFYNKNLIENFKNYTRQEIIKISLECADININSGINFQQFCDFNLLFIRNSFLSYNKKFNFIKDLILRIFMSERFNTKNGLKKLKLISKNIDINTVKKILNSDMISVKLKNNIDIYNDVQKLYDEYIKYIEH